MNWLYNSDILLEKVVLLCIFLNTTKNPGEKNINYSIFWDHTSTDLRHLKYQSKQWQWQADLFHVE